MDEKRERDPNKCIKPACRRCPCATYLGYRLCDYHWQVLASFEGEGWRRSVVAYLGLPEDREAQLFPDKGDPECP